VIVGLVDDQVVASVMVGHDGHRGWLYYVAVDPNHRGSGFGAAIVEAGENWLRSRQVPKVMLLIRETNTKVEAFYKNIGYETIPRIIMQKWLIEQ
jgi:ribosomal protein S18 acetylase RimI-like enzyme